MRTELTYAVDQMARYQGDMSAALENTAEYYKQGGLSDTYFNRVAMFMSWVKLANNYQLWAVPAPWRNRLVKAMRKTLPRVHTEASTWKLNYMSYLESAADLRQAGHYQRAMIEVRCARNIRERYM